MDHHQALALVNKELKQAGLPLLVLSETQSQRAFASLRVYANNSKRPIEVAIADVVRHEVQKRSIRSNR